jgi:uncharacterized protein HemX
MAVRAERWPGVAKVRTTFRLQPLMKLNTFLSAVALLAVTGANAAGTETPRIDQRQANQEARIAQGAASGSLTAREQRRLGRQQDAINKGEAKAKADGTVTAGERHALRHAQRHASRDIARQKHDGQTAKP